MAELIMMDKALAQLVETARAKLQIASGELELDFSSVRRLDAHGLHELEQLAQLAEERGVTLVLRNVSVEIYRVVKTVKLAPRFKFAA